MTNRVAIITGATSGIGASFARQLGAQGYDLVLVGRRKERLDQLAGELKNANSISAQVAISDLATLEGIQAVEALINSTPDLDMLVNNAGFGVSGNFADTDIEDNLDMIEVHVIATVRFTRKALPGMLARKKGSIINVSSLAAFLPQISDSVTYSATKSYLNAFSETLWKELRGSGVRVQALCPGFTLTDFHDRPGLEGFTRESVPKIAWMTADKVVEKSLKALEHDRVICIPGLLNQVISVIGRNPLFVWTADRVMENRKG